MNDLIELKLVTEDEAECLHRLQVEAFMPLYEKYQDCFLQALFGQNCKIFLDIVACPNWTMLQ